MNVNVPTGDHVGSQFSNKFCSEYLWKYVEKLILNLPTSKLFDCKILFSFNLKTKALQIVKGVRKIVGKQSGQFKLPQ